MPPTTTSYYINLFNIGWEVLGHWNAEASCRACHSKVFDTHDLCPYAIFDFQSPGAFSASDGLDHGELGMLQR
jgi:hypothetical protein